MTSLLERLNHLVFGEQGRKRQLFYAPSALPTESIPTDPSIVWGCDFSGQWDGPIDFFKYKSRGARFVVIKIADGTIKARFVDENVRAAKSFGLVVGGYYWLYRNARISGRAQAEAWWNISKDLDLDFHSIDFEWSYWLGRQDNPDSSDLWGAAEPFRLLSGKYPFIYSARGYMDQYFNHAATWKPFAFWEAQYGVLAPDAVQPWGAHGHTLWQCASNWPGAELGVDPAWSRGEDGNIFNGSVRDFETMFATTTPEPPPDEPPVEPPATGEPMTEYPNGVKILEGAVNGWGYRVMVVPASAISRVTLVRASPSTTVENIPGDIAFNLSPFDTSGAPNLGLKIGGVTIRAYVDFNPFVYWLNGKLYINHVKTIFNGQSTAGQGFRYLIQNGAKNAAANADWNFRSARRVLATNAAGDTIILTVKGVSGQEAGLTLHEVCTLLFSLSLGVTWAMDADSGGSAQDFAKVNDVKVVFRGDANEVRAVPVYGVINLLSPLVGEIAPPPPPPTTEDYWIMESPTGERRRYVPG